MNIFGAFFTPTRLACGVLTVQKGYRLGFCERAVTLSPRTDLGTKILVPIVDIIVLVVNLVMNTLSSKRLDAKRHYVILAKALSAVLRHQPPPPCLSTALHRHGQLAKYHPVSWLR